MMHTWCFTNRPATTLLLLRASCAVESVKKDRNTRVHAYVENDTRVQAYVENGTRVQAYVENGTRVHAYVENDADVAYTPLVCVCVYVCLLEREDA